MLLHLLEDFLIIQLMQLFERHQVASVGLRVRHVLKRVGGKLLARCYSSFLKNYLCIPAYSSDTSNMDSEILLKFQAKVNASAVFLCDAHYFLTK